MEQSNENVESAEQAVLDEAEKVHQERMETVRELAASVARRVELEQQVVDAVKEEKRLATAAEKVGWTPAQVKRFAKRAKEQPRKRKVPTTPQQPAPEVTSTEDESGNTY